MLCKVYNCCDFQNGKESPTAYLEAERRNLKATFLSCLRMSYTPIRDRTASSAGMGLLDGATPMSAKGHSGSLWEHLSKVMLWESYFREKRQKKMSFCVFFEWPTCWHGLSLHRNGAGTAVGGPTQSASPGSCFSSASCAMSLWPGQAGRKSGEHFIIWLAWKPFLGGNLSCWGLSNT